MVALRREGRWDVMCGVRHVGYVLRRKAKAGRACLVSVHSGVRIPDSTLRSLLYSFDSSEGRKPSS
jgi:hypothetical protein